MRQIGDRSGGAGLEGDVHLDSAGGARLVEHAADTRPLGQANDRVPADLSQRGPSARPRAWSSGTTATSRSLTIGSASNPAGAVPAAPTRATSTEPRRTRSTSRSEFSSIRLMSTPGWARWKPASASNNGVTVHPVTMPTTSRPRRSPFTSSTAWRTASTAASTALAPSSAAGAGGRQARRAAGPVEERCAEVRFELADLRADAGLADVHRAGRTGEVRLLGHGDEVLELPEFHNYRF